jgi:hypothetical protein
VAVGVLLWLPSAPGIGSSRRVGHWRRAFRKEADRRGLGRHIPNT